MIDKLKYIFYFVFLLLVQTLILDQVSVSVYVNAFVYILFVMMLPIDTNKYVVLLLGLLMGLCVDLFNSTLGLHASAGLLAAFVRSFALDIYSPHDGYENNKQLSVRNYGYGWFLKYAITIILIHHLWLFIFESMSISNFLFTLAKAGVSSLTSLAVILLFHLMLMSRK